jgi:hypothetical protein
VGGGAREAWVEALDLERPQGVYSLSYLAGPCPVDDPICGLEPDPDNLFGVQRRTLEPRDERGLLVVSPAARTRLRCNPFSGYVERRLRETARSGLSRRTKPEAADSLASSDGARQQLESSEAPNADPTVRGAAPPAANPRGQTAEAGQPGSTPKVLPAE